MDAIFASKYQTAISFLFCPLFGGWWIYELGMYMYKSSEKTEGRMWIPNHYDSMIFTACTMFW